MTILLDKIPPHNLEAEQSTIGSLLISREAWYDLRDLGLTATDFYREAHEVIFDTVSRMYDAEQQVDVVTVQDALRASGKLVKAGGIEYLASLIDNTPTARNARYYGQIVKDKAARRAVLDRAGQLIAAAQDEGRDLSEIAVIAAGVEAQLSDRMTAGEWASYADVIPDVSAHIMDAYESKTALMGIPSGLPRLDAITCGWHGGDLIVLAARPSDGKTALALQFAEYAAKHNNPVGVFSLEMRREALAIRAIQAASGLSGYGLRDPKTLAAPAMARLVQAMGPLADLPVYIYDESIIRHTEIFPLARRAVLKHGVKMLMLDFTQLAKGPTGESRNREVGEIAQSMKSTAMKLNVPFLALSQLSRECEKAGRAPRLSDLRDSGEIEAIADVVLFVHYPHRDAETGDRDPNASLIVAKNRQLGTGTAPVRWMPETMRFVERVNTQEVA